MHSNSMLLVVEDDPNDVLLLSRALRKAALSNPVQFVNDGEAAIAYLAGQGEYKDRERYPLPALVLLDLKVPRKSGLEVLAWLRLQPGLKRLPVIVLTSSKEPSDVSRAYEMGANAYLVKPAVSEALVDIVRAINLFWLRLAERPDLQAR